MLTQTFAMVNNPQLNFQLVAYQINTDRIPIAELLRRGACYPRRRRDAEGQLDTHPHRPHELWPEQQHVCDGLRLSILGRIQLRAPEVFESLGDDMADAYGRIQRECEKRRDAARGSGLATVGSRYWENWAAYAHEARWMMEQQPEDATGAA